MGTGTYKELTVEEATTEISTLKTHFNGRSLDDIRALYDAGLLSEADARVLRRMMDLEWLLSE
jgi:hypothetical protein